MFPSEKDFVIGGSDAQLEFDDLGSLPKKRAVTALIFNDNKILGVSRKDDLTKMGLPGGKVEPGESLADAIKRETIEETGLEIVVIERIYQRMDGEYECTTFLCSLVQSHTGDQFPTNESGRVAWVTWEDLFNGAFSEYNLALFKAFLTEEFDCSIKDVELVRSIALYANYTGDTSLFAKVKTGMEFAGLYPETQKQHTILPDTVHRSVGDGN